MPAAGHVAGDRGEDASGGLGRVVTEHTSGPDQEVHLAQVLPGAFHHPPACIKGDLLPSGVTSQRDPDGSSRDSFVVKGLPIVAGKERGIRAAYFGGTSEPLGVGAVEQPRGESLLNGGYGAPPHAEVAFDGATHGYRRDDLPRETGVLRVDLDDRVHVSGGTADVDNHHVADPGTSVAAAVRKEFHTCQDKVGRGPANHVGEAVTGTG